MFQDKTMISRLKNLVSEDDDGCWIWQAQKFKAGYGRIKIRTQVGCYKNMQAHRVSYRVFKGEIPDGLLVRHSCHKKACINPAHLHLGTHDDNMRDRDEAGRTKQGAQVYNFIRTPEKAAEVSALRRNGHTINQVCQIAGISWGTYHTMRQNGEIDAKRIIR